MAGVVGLQQLLRMQGLEWGDSAGHDYHLWFDGGGLNIDGPFTLAPTVNASAAYAAFQVTPTFIDTPASSTNYAFKSAASLILTKNSTATQNGVANFTLASDASAFNYAGNNNVYYGSSTFYGSGTAGNWGFIQGSANTDATSTGAITELGGAHLDANHSGTGLAATVYGVVGRARLGPSGGAADGNVTNMTGVIAETFMDGVAVTPGVVTNARGFVASSPSFASSSTSTATNFYSFTNSVPFNTIGFTSTSGGFTAAGFVMNVGKQGGNTSGTNNNYGLDILSGVGTSGNGGVVNNIAIIVAVPSPVGVAGGNNKNIAIQITGAGGTGSGVVGNWALQSTSTCNSVFAGTLGVGSATAAAAQTMFRVIADATVASVSNTPWNGISVFASTLTLTGGTNITLATGVNLINIAQPTITSTSATTVANAATLAIADVPLAAGSGPVVITRPWALWVQAGSSLFGGALVQGHATAAINSTATASAAQAATGYITSTSAATVTITLPTGTALGAALGAVQGTVFDLFIDNTAGSNVVTIAVNTNAILSADAAANAASIGLLTVPSGVTGQARFTLMFSSATAYTFSRTA